MNESFKLKMVKCEDGSHTLYRPDLDEHYHSVFGAVSESLHIFINAGFNYLSRSLSNIKILEVGFGTGLNALLTYIGAIEKDIKVSYTGLDNTKLPGDIISKLNYYEMLENESSKELFLQIHSAKWNREEQLSTFFNLHKVEVNVEDVVLDENIFNLIYFDAFAPVVQPELWTNDIFLKIYRSMKKGAILLTYSCKGEVKRTLKGIGFCLEKLPGPKGKREFLRATK